MPSINCKVELNHRWIKNCVLSLTGENDVVNSDSIIFAVKDTKLYVVNLSAKKNRKLSKHFSKEFKRSVYGRTKIQQMKIDIFSNQTL